MRSCLRFGLALALILSTCSIARCRQETELAPDTTWQGTLDLGPASLRLQFRFVRQDDGSYRGTLISLDQGNTSIEVDSLEIKGRQVDLACKKIRAKYSGTFDESFQKISGTFTQGSDLPLDLVPAERAENLKHVETWTGILKAGPREFDFQVRVFKDEHGKRHGKLDSFSENLGDLGLEFAEGEADDFNFTLPISKAAFEGKYNADHNRIEGKWIQGGGNFDLSFERVDLLKTRSVIPPKRPQNPTPPLPYREIDVQCENVADNVTLSGTLTLPKETGKYAAAILISGSGGQDRDETLLDHKPFLVLSDHLTRAGFAVLRFDDRGVGKSTGDAATADTRDFARDVAALVDYLKGHEEIDAKKIGLIGHSEGGLIAPLVATSREDIAFIVMLAGPGVDGREIVLNQTELIAKAEAASPAEIEVQAEYLKTALELIATDKSSDEIKAALHSRFEELREKLPKEKQVEVTSAMLDASIAPMLSPWFRFFLSYDPRPALSKLRCPVLALNGELDLQVDPELNLPVIREAFKESGNPDTQVVELAGLNHLFQTAKTGSPTEYRTIEETMSPTALQAISDWLTERFK